MKNTIVRTDLKNSFPALKYRDFRYFWFGQSISLVGTWIQITALQWFVYTLTKSALLLGLLGVAQFGPVLFFSLFAGVLVDRYPRKQIIVFAQTAAMIQALLLSLIVFFGHHAYWEIFALSVLSGLINAIDTPARQSFVPEIVPKNDLHSAIGLNMVVFNSAKIIGPALAALLLTQLHPSFLFLLNGISFLPAIILIQRIRIRKPAVGHDQEKVLTEIHKGFSHIRRSPTILSTILALFILSTFLMNFYVIIPIYAVDVLNQSVGGYGILMSALGIGSLVGSFLIASGGKEGNHMRRLFTCAFLDSLLFILLNFIHTLASAVALLVVIGFLTIVFLSTANLTLQLNTSDAFRGRIMSIYSFSLLGTTPIGNLIAGAITENFGAGMGFLICGVITAILILIVFVCFIEKSRPSQNNT